MKSLLIKAFLTITCLTLLVSCDRQQDQNTPKEITELNNRVNEMQQEQRLILKEVISLQKKLDSILASNQFKPQGAAGRSNKTITLPNIERLQGDDNAEYAIVEFMDYQCPYCIRYATQVLPTLKQQYVDSGKLKYGIRDYPLSFHSKAEGAAIAANCAGKQSEYWPMHDELVDNFKNLSGDLYQTSAKKLNLNIEDFSACLDDPEMKQAVVADLAYAAEVGVRGTPNFYIGKIDGDSIINTVQLTGARSLEEFDRAIQQAMSVK